MIELKRPHHRAPGKQEHLTWGKGISESLATVGGPSTTSARIQTKNCLLDFLKHRPPWVRAALLGPAHPRPCRPRQAAVSCPGSRRPLSTQPGHPCTVPQPSPGKGTGPPPLLPRLPGPTEPPCTLGKAGRRKEIPESQSPRMFVFQSLNSLG